jgi:hypothetical protein
VEDGGAKEEKKKLFSTRKEEDEDLPPLDSSDDESSDEEDTYQEDGFVVADASDEDLPDVGEDDEAGKSRSRLKRLRKGGKRKRLELDQEDLDLVASAQGLAPSSKLRKTVADAEGSGQPLSISIAKSDSSRTSFTLLIASRGSKYALDFMISPTSRPPLKLAMPDSVFVRCCSLFSCTLWPSLLFACPSLKTDRYQNVLYFSSRSRKIGER